MSHEIKPTNRELLESYLSDCIDEEYFVSTNGESISPNTLGFCLLGIDEEQAKHLLSSGLIKGGKKGRYGWQISATALLRAFEEYGEMFMRLRHEGIMDNLRMAAEVESEDAVVTAWKNGGAS